MSAAAILNPSSSYWPSTALSKRGRSRLFLFFTGLAIGIGCFVLIEPAPVDVLTIGLFVLGVLSGILELGSIKATPALFLGLFIVANFVSLYDPLDLTRATWYLAVTIYLIGSLSFFVSFLQAYETPGMQTIIRAYVSAAILCVIIGLLSYFKIIGFQHYLLLSGRPKGLFKDPNVFGPYVIAPALFALAGVICKGRGLRSGFIHGISLAITTGGVILSYSRACWINYAVCLVVYIGLGYLLTPVGFPPLFPMRRLIAGCLLGIAALCILLQLPQVQNMMRERIASNGLHGYDQDRFRTQRLALASAQNRPLGIGPGQAEETFQYATHSSYLRVLSENGLLGLVGYVGFVVASLIRALVMTVRTDNIFWKKIYLIAAACITGHIINSAVVDTVHWRHYWLLLALPWCSVPMSGTSAVKPSRFRPAL